MLIHIAGSKSGFRDDFGHMTQKPLWRFFGQTPLRNSVAMATPKIPGDQKVFEKVCYMLKLKVTNFQLPRPIKVSELYLKNQLGANLSPPSKIGLMGGVLLPPGRQVH